MPWPHALRAFSRPAVRRFFAGQAVSLLGSWMQPVALSWLAWRLAHSEALLGLVNFLGYAPALVLAGAGGAVADRFPRKPVVLLGMGVAMLHASLLAALTFSGLMTPVLLAAAAVLVGTSSAFEIPSRQALFADLAGEDTPNIVALNSTLVTVMRVLGPAVGGLVVASFGEAWCFVANALSFLAVLFALATIRVPPRPRSRGDQAPTGGLRFALKTPRVAGVLALLFFVALFGFPWATLMPVVAEVVLSGGPELLGRLLACAGVGSLLGALTLLLRGEGLDLRVGLGALCLGAGLGVLSLSSSTLLSAGALVVIGFGQISLSSSTLTLMQVWAPKALRGRLMGVFTAIFMGVPPFGALAVGALAHRFDTQVTLRGQGLAVFAVGVAYLVALRSLRKTPLPVEAVTVEPVEPRESTASEL